MSASVKVITTESEAGALQMFLVPDEFNSDSPEKPAEENEACDLNEHHYRQDNHTHSEAKDGNGLLQNEITPENESLKTEARGTFDKPSRRSLRLKAGKKPLNYSIKSEVNDILDIEAHLSALVPAKKSTPTKKVNPDNKPFSCYLCGLKCKTAANLKQHEQTHTDVDRPFICGHCNYACKRKSDLKKHEETHGPSNAFKCLECDYSGKRLKYLKKHMRIHNRDSSFSCHICQYRCLSKSTFDKHLANHSSDDILSLTELKPFTCEHCSEGFENKWALNKHLETHSGNTPYFCVVCGAAFKSKEYLRKHENQHKPGKTSVVKSEPDDGMIVEIKVEQNENSNSSDATIILENNLNHTVEKLKKDTKLIIPRMKGGPIQCPMCIYSCSTKNLLRRHMRRHSDVKPYICTQCGAAFKRKDHLKVHKNTHNNARPHTCPHCSYGTHRKYRLKLHILTHQTVKPITCPSCDYRCRRYCELSYHMRNKHKVEVEGDSDVDQKVDSSADVELKCDKCDYTCDSVKRLKYHMARHENKTPHSCPHCDYKCSSRSSLSDHLLRHAGIKPCLCSVCGAAFRNTSRLNRHKLVHSDIKPYGCHFCDFSSRSKYNLKQHMLRHTDQERTRRRRKPKTQIPYISPMDTTTEIIKESFQSDLQPLISQLTSSAYLETISSKDLNPVFPDQQDPIKLTEHQLSLANQLFNRSISDLTMLRDQGSNSSFSFPGGSAMGQTSAYQDAYQQVNSLLSQNNTMAYSPGIAKNHPNFNYLDRNGGYAFSTPYIYNETVFPGSMGANMNFYMNPGTSSPLNSDTVSQSAAQNSVPLNHSSGSGLDEHPVLSPSAAELASNVNHKHENESSHMDNDDMVLSDDISVDIPSNSNDVSEEGEFFHRASRKYGNSDNSSKPAHICFECGYIAVTKTMLQRHKLTHTDVKPFKCEQCEKAFKRRDHMKAHMRTHNSDKLFSCNICSFTSNRKYRLTIHEKTHTLESVFSCSVCETTYPTDEDLKEHLKTHEDGKVLECDKCDFKCADSEEFRSHSDGHKSFLCDKCSYVCRSSREFASHKKMHEDREELTCSICNYTCDSQKRLRYHMERHDNKTPLACTQCDYKCSSRSSLSDHILRHEGVKPFLCSDCGMSFRNVSRLNRHKLTHTDIKPHSCDYCSFSSRSRYNLKQHMSKHFK
ncbi:zinc finger protein Xfin [Biomphalaria glabrata]|nr:zinc finger protein Xfin [Biomphalaria glabrata]